MEDNENRKFDRAGSALRGQRRPGVDPRADPRARGAAPRGRAHRGGVPRGQEGTPRPDVTAAAPGRQPRPVGHRDAARLGRRAGRLHPVLRAARPAARRRHQGPGDRRRSSPWRPTWWSCARRRTAGRTPTPSTAAGVATRRPRHRSVADVGPGAAGAGRGGGRRPRRDRGLPGTGRARRAAGRGRRRAAAPGVRADLAAAVDVAVGRHLRLVAAGRARRRQRVRRRAGAATPR